MNNRIEEIFGQRVAGWAERTAIEVGDRRISYRELDERSNRVARRLVQAGVLRNDIVAIGTGNIDFFALAVLAILKAGAAYLSVDTRYPVERVSDILAAAAPRIFLSDADLPASLIPAGLPVIRDFMQDNSVGDPLEPLPPAGLSADDVACVFYTSGSSGRPKGIEVMHRGIPRLVSDTSLLSFGQNDRIGQATNFAFDVINFELWGALLNGGCIVRIPKHELLSAPALGAFLENKRITALMLTTSLFNALAAGDPTIFKPLQALVIAGEAADPHSIARVFHSGQRPARFVNAYGPTEATTFATWHEVTPTDVALGYIPIGKAVEGMRLYLLDDRMKPVPVGETGELLIGGPGVAKGYLRQPALTDEAFVANPFDPETAPRLYRTGDLCRQSPDGNLEYLGRLDDQVKIRGFRVEPSEVAAILRKLPGVEDAIVLSRTTAFKTQELIGFVRGKNLSEAKTLRSTLAKLVPDYMLPSIIYPIDAFPLTANGKLDRVGLLEKIRFDIQRAPTDGADEVGNRLAKIWMNVLKRDDIEQDDDFHELGGDSLSLMHLALEIETNFGVVLSPDVFVPPLILSLLADQIRAKLSLGESSKKTASASEEAKVFAVSYPWIMGQIPEEVGQALCGGRGRWMRLQLPLSYFGSTSTVTIEGMAEHLEQLVYTRSPTGPYVLFGHCITGLLAYELAQRLVAAGHTVSAVIAFDSYPVAKRTWLKRLRYAAWRISVFFDLDFKNQVSKLYSKARPGPVNQFQEHIRAVCWEAMRRYRPQPYNGRMLFFRHENEAALIEQDATAWRRLVRGELTEHLINMHDRGHVTSESVAAAFRELAAMLKKINLSDLAPIEHETVSDATPLTS